MVLEISATDAEKVQEYLKENNHVIRISSLYAVRRLKRSALDSIEEQLREELRKNTQKDGY